MSGNFKSNFQKNVFGAPPGPPGKIAHPKGQKPGLKSSDRLKKNVKWGGGGGRGELDKKINPILWTRGEKTAHPSTLLYGKPLLGDAEKLAQPVLTLSKLPRSGGTVYFIFRATVGK